MRAISTRSHVQVRAEPVHARAHADGADAQRKHGCWACGACVRVRSCQCPWCVADEFTGVGARRASQLTLGAFAVAIAEAAIEQTE